MKPTFEQAIDILKKDIQEGRIKVTPEMMGQFMNIFTPIPTLKLKKETHDIKVKSKCSSRAKNGLIKINLFNRISW